MAYGFIPGISKWSPFHGAAYAVMVSLAKLAAMGAAPLDARLTFQEYFERRGRIPPVGQARGGAARRVFSPKGDGGPLHRREGFDVGQL